MSSITHRVVWLLLCSSWHSVTTVWGSDSLCTPLQCPHHFFSLHIFCGFCWFLTLLCGKSATRQTRTCCKELILGPRTHMSLEPKGFLWYGGLTCTCPLSVQHTVSSAHSSLQRLCSHYCWWYWSLYQRKWSGKNKVLRKLWQDKRELRSECFWRNQKS